MCMELKEYLQGKLNFACLRGSLLKSSGSHGIILRLSFEKQIFQTCRILTAVKKSLNLRQEQYF